MPKDRPTFPGDPFVNDELEYNNASYICCNGECGKAIAHPQLQFPDVPPGAWFRVSGDDVWIACSEECAKMISGDGWKRRPRKGHAPLKRTT